MPSSKAPTDTSVAGSQREIGSDIRAVGAGILVGTLRSESVVAARVVDEAHLG